VERQIWNSEEQSFEDFHIVMIRKPFLHPHRIPFVHSQRRRSKIFFWILYSILQHCYMARIRNCDTPCMHLNPECLTVLCFLWYCYGVIKLVPMWTTKQQANCFHHTCLLQFINHGIVFFSHNKTASASLSAEHALFAWLISYGWKYRWLICWKRKILFVGWKSTAYKPKRTE